MTEAAVVRYGFMYEYLYLEDEVWRSLCELLRGALDQQSRAVADQPADAPASRASLHDCPMETVLHIMSFLDARGLAAWGQTCQLFVEPSLLDAFWERLLRHTYCVSVHAFTSNAAFVIAGSRTAKQLFATIRGRLRELLTATTGVSISASTLSVHASLLPGIAAH